ncbi:hypothetical protein GCM10025868_14690 [Angustibacter aerolatus]|uniref:Uncharacterized protein n=1 Tax=Angustibacter aerolatus TaxID=1162965 RepID=A0ABQ6JEI6_9ACTN|nr:hypothetical protein GCM10025868_14690 [Angustibacter aerolatus]
MLPSSSAVAAAGESAATRPDSSPTTTSGHVGPTRPDASAPSTVRLRFLRTFNRPTDSRNRSTDAGSPAGRTGSAPTSARPSPRPIAVGAGPPVAAAMRAASVRVEVTTAPARRASGTMGAK